MISEKSRFPPDLLEEKKKPDMFIKNKKQVEIANAWQQQKKKHRKEKIYLVLPAVKQTQLPALYPI